MGLDCFVAYLLALYYESTKVATMYATKVNTEGVREHYRA
jgi:hypothetical protein